MSFSYGLTLGSSCALYKGSTRFSKQPWNRSTFKGVHKQRLYVRVGALQQVSDTTQTLGADSVKKYDDLTQKTLDFVDKLSNLYRKPEGGPMTDFIQNIQDKVDKMSDSVTTAQQDVVENLNAVDIQKGQDVIPRVEPDKIAQSSEAVKDIGLGVTDLKSSIRGGITSSIQSIQESVQSLKESQVPLPKAGDTSVSAGGIVNVLKDKISDTIESATDLTPAPIIPSTPTPTAPPTPTPIEPPTPMVPPAPTPTPSVELPTQQSQSLPEIDTSGAIGEAKDALSGITSAGTQSLDKAKDALSGTFSGVGQSFTKVTTSGTDSLGKAQQGVQDSFQSVLDSIVGAYSAANEGFKNSIDQTATGISQSVIGAEEAIAEQVRGLFEQLPPEVQQVLNSIGAGVGQLVQLTQQYPITSASIIAFLAFLVVSTYYRATFAGFAGELSPVAAQNMLLDSNNSLLVDIRSDESREETGVPELRRGARKRAVSVPYKSNYLIPKYFVKRLRNPKELQEEIFTTYIAGLPMINRNTAVILMDEGKDETLVKSLARALYRLYLPNSYVMQGGYQGWEDKQLPIRMDATNYEVTTSEIIQDEIDVIKEQTEDVVETLSNPQILVGVVAILATTTYVAVNYEKTLQFIGFLGIILTVYWRVSKRYDSWDDVGQDATRFLEFVGGLVEQAGFGPPSEMPQYQPAQSVASPQLLVDDDIEVVLPEEEEEEEEKEAEVVGQQETEQNASVEVSNSQNSQPEQQQQQEQQLELQEQQELQDTKSDVSGNNYQEKSQKVELSNESVSQ